MTIITYTKIVDNQRVYASEVFNALAQDFPSHREEIEKIMELEKLEGWTINLTPSKNGEKICNGTLLHGINTILLSLASREEMLVTLYHEIIHHKYAEEMIEGLARYKFARYEEVEK